MASAETCEKFSKLIEDHNAQEALHQKVINGENADSTCGGHFFVLSDSHGFLGAFTSKDFAAAVVTKFNSIPMILQKFKVHPGPINKVWVILYNNTNIVAYVTNDRDDAIRVNKIYARIGLVYEDEIDFWEQKINVISEYNNIRLDKTYSAHNMFVIGVTELFEENAANNISIPDYAPVNLFNGEFIEESEVAAAECV